MKLLRYGPPGAEKPGLLDKDGTIRCLSAVVRDIDGFALSDAALKMIAGIDPNTLPKVDASVRLGACVARPVNYVCIGLNYADHAATGCRSRRNRCCSASGSARFAARTTTLKFRVVRRKPIGKWNSAW